MKNNLKKIITYLAIIFALLLVIALIGSIKFPWQQSFRVVFGSFYVLFLPGFIWSYVFFNKNDNKEKPLDGIERILLSFALSLALSPLLLFFLNMVGMAINLLSVFIVNLLFIVIGIIIITYKIFQNNSGINE